MKTVMASVAVLTAALSFTAGGYAATGDSTAVANTRHPLTAAGPRTAPARHLPAPAEMTPVVKRYCGSCHSATTRKGNLSLDNFKVEDASADVEVSEKMIRKLRADIMPPPGSRRPTGDTLELLTETLEHTVDKAAPIENPGSRGFQRLNRPEYENVVRDLLGVNVNAADFLPLDTKSANFDNIADAQAMSATLLDGYLNAAAAVSRMAIGDRHAVPAVKTFRASPFVSQHPWDHLDGAPYGTRGGIVAQYNFPADGDYAFRVNIEGGLSVPNQDVDVSVNGQQVALLHYEKGVEPVNASADSPLGADNLHTDAIHIKAGQQTVSVAFVRHSEGPYEDLIKPSEWSLASNGNGSAGATTPPHVIEFAILGPSKVTGLSETPSRKLIFSCNPSKGDAPNAANHAASDDQPPRHVTQAGAAEEARCADQIITRLATRAYRRPLTTHDRDGLMAFYTAGAKEGGFEAGVQRSVQAMLASPYFVFRFETAPKNVAPGKDYKVSDIELASRLSFFLWGSIPDNQLITLAENHQLSQPATLNAQVKRMLKDPRSEALTTRFASQWLRLQDLDKVRPDAFLFPDYDQQLADAMTKETQLFFSDIVKNDHSVLDLLTADYTFVNERLARHYGIPNVSGPEFRRVNYPDDSRRGLLGQGTILVQTSQANRTSPVLRGKWVMEVLIGMPPPPPPPNVPALDDTQDAKDGHQLTTRERMEIHRANPTCNACHQYMDPIGLSLDNFDVTGKWRYRENGIELDTKGKMYDGTPLSSSADLRKALIARPVPMMRTFAENLMAYAVGRRMEDYDQPTIRAITREAEAHGYRVSSFIMGVVNSAAFRTKRVEAPAEAEGNGNDQR
jgi:hypothetical protein